MEDWERDWKDYYKVLQVDPAAEQEVVKGAHDRLARKYHPDVNKDPSALERMKEINGAYEVLGNPEKRRRYDIAWHQKQGKGAYGANAPVPPKPVVDPGHIQFSNVNPGVPQTVSFTIKNVGGAYKKILVRNPPSSWVKIKGVASLTLTDELPAKVGIEAQGQDWGKTYVEYITVALDDVETQVTVELQTQPEARKPNPPPVQPPPPPKNPWVKWLAVVMGISIIAAIAIILPKMFTSPPPSTGPSFSAFTATPTASSPPPTPTPTPWRLLMDGIQSSIPKGVTIDTVSQQESEITVRGVAPTLSLVLQYANAIRLLKLTVTWE